MIELDGVAAGIDDISALALTNYGHFTSMRVEKACVRGLSLHIERLRSDCLTLFDAELDPDRVRALIRRAVGDRAEPVVVRATVFDPDLDLGNPAGPARPRVLVTARPAGLPTLTPLRLQSVSYCRDMPTVKHVGLFPILRHRRVAQLAGYDDVLFVDAGNAVSEVATSNIGVIDGERIIWPSAPCLPGVTMRLIDRVRGEHITRPLTLADLPGAEAVFATNAAVGIRPIAGIDTFTWQSATHPTIQKIREQYASIAAESL